MLVVQAEAGNSGHQRMFDYVGRVEAAAEADLQDAGVGRRSCEGEESDGGRDLEEARFDVAARVDDFSQEVRELIVFDQPTGNADAFVEANEMGAGEGMDLEPRGFEAGAQECDRRAFAVGSGDMEHGRERVLRPAKPVEKSGYPFKPEPVAGRRNHRQPVELRLDARVRRAREIGHQAAAFFSGRGARYLIRSASLLRRSERGTTMSIIPCSSRYSARWKPSGNFSRIVCSITRWPAKPISAPGSASWTSPSIA